MPSLGKGPGPKISSGSRTMLVRQPVSRAAIGIFIRPTAWKIFSNARVAMMTVENRNAMRE